MTEFEQIILTVMAYSFTLGLVVSGLNLVRQIKRDKQTFFLKEIAVELLFPGLFNFKS